MSTNAYNGVLQTSSDDSTYTSVAGVSTLKVSAKVDTVDKTALGGNGAMARKALTQTGSCQISGDWNDGDTGQANVLFNEGGTVYLKMWFNDGTWIRVPGIVESYSLEAGGEGKVTFSVTVNVNAAVTNGTGTLPVDTPENAPGPGYSSTLKITGSTTATTGEACSLVSGKTYQVDNTAKRIIDHTVAITVKDGGVAVSASDIDHLDYLFGKVTFVAGYTPSGPITMDYSYLPLVAVAETKQWKLSVKNKLIDKTSLDSAGVKQFAAGLGDASGSFGTLTLPTASVGAGALIALITSRTQAVVEINLGSGNVFHAWTVFESEDVDLKPDALVETGFSWSNDAKGAGSSEASYAWG